jgi:hypothetical protein
VKFTLSPAGEIAQVSAGGAAPGLDLATAPQISAEEAVRGAYSSMSLDSPSLSPIPATLGKYTFANPRGGKLSPISAELCVFPVAANEARLAWRIFLDFGTNRYYEILLDASDGKTLLRHNLYVDLGQGNV